MTIEAAYETLLWFSCAVIAIMMLLCLVMVIIGPRYTDRVVVGNMVYTKSIIMISVLSFLLDIDGIMDISCIYAMIGFLAMVVLSKCYMLPHHYSPADPRHIFFAKLDDTDEEAEGTEEIGETGEAEEI